MHKLILPFMLFILFNLHGINMCSQKVKVITKSIEEIDNKLVIKYDLVKSKAIKQFDVTLEVTNSVGNKISIKSLKGDIGNNITGGQGKQIIWDYNADGIVIQEKIYFEIFAEPIIDESLVSKPVGTGKALLLSTIWPGLGMSKTEKGKPYWLMGIAAYGTLGYSYMLNKKANDSYSSYLSNIDKNLNDGLLSDSQNQNKRAKTMGYTAVGIWGINLIWTAIKVKNSKQNEISSLNNKNFVFYTGYDPFTKTAGFNLRIQF